MSEVLGLDLSLAHTGAASLTDRGTVATWLLETAPASGVLDVDARLSRIARWVMTRVTTGTVLAVIEAPSFGSQHGLQHERAGLHWRVIRGLVAREIPIAVCPPTTLKKAITGSGRASKQDLQDAVAALYPKQGLGKVSEHEADAVGLAILGAQNWCRWSGPWLGLSPTALAAVQWPERVA